MAIDFEWKARLLLDQANCFVSEDSGCVLLECIFFVYKNDFKLK